mmetsp:Transcript_15269/g.45598  ORF Transcript_15269/g.45598 Transcript_15269/m.45598 type:complete len:182 (-) Transcript_15269:26-571(-)
MARSRLTLAFWLATAAAMRPPARNFAPPQRCALPRRALLLAPLLAPRAAGAADVAAARAQWKAASKEINDILKDWESIQGGGDGIRRRIGTVGTTSPLFQIEKACRALIPEAEDPVEFGDALEELVLGLGRVDGMAYSSNFAGGSGKPSENSATVYIERSRKELQALKKDVARMDKALGPR